MREQDTIMNKDPRYDTLGISPEKKRHKKIIADLDPQRDSG